GATSGSSPVRPSSSTAAAEESSSRSCIARRAVRFLSGASARERDDARRKSARANANGCKVAAVLHKGAVMKKRLVPVLSFVLLAVVAGAVFAQKSKTATVVI